MPSGHLDESYVRKAAVGWLADHYKNQLNPKALVPATEAWLYKNSKYGWGRADGLITALLEDNTFYTVSLEAKSHRTWRHIKVQNKNLNWIFHMLVIGALLFLVGLFVGNLLGGGFLELALTILLMVVGIAIFIKLTYWSSRYQLIEVLSQAKRYPANEQWIALSTDIFNRIGRENQFKDFERACQREGIGLLRVSANKKVTTIISPQKKAMPKGLETFLNCYARETEIRQEIKRMQLAGIKVEEPIDLGGDYSETIPSQSLQTEQIEP